MKRLALLLLVAGCAEPTWNGTWRNPPGDYQFVFDGDAYEWIRGLGPDQREAGTFEDADGELRLTPTETTCPPLAPTVVKWDKLYVHPRERRLRWGDHSVGEPFGPMAGPATYHPEGCSTLP